MLECVGVCCSEVAWVARQSEPEEMYVGESWRALEWVCCSEARRIARKNEDMCVAVSCSELQ